MLRFARVVFLRKEFLTQTNFLCNLFYLYERFVRFELKRNHVAFFFFAFAESVWKLDPLSIARFNLLRVYRSLLTKVFLCKCNVFDKFNVLYVSNCYMHHGKMVFYLIPKQTKLYNLCQFCCNVLLVEFMFEKTRKTDFQMLIYQNYERWKF